jgi:hypothetical protein
LADGLLDRPGYIRQRRRLKAKLDELEEQIAKVRAKAPKRRLRGASMEELSKEWSHLDLDLDEQRAVLADPHRARHPQAGGAWTQAVRS